jgi:hypothetical protein
MRSDLYEMRMTKWTYIFDRKKLTNSGEEIYCSCDEEPCSDRDDESDECSCHSFFRFVDSWAITSDTRVDLHLDSMIYEGEYSNRTSDREECRYSGDYHLRNSIHIYITGSEVSISYTIALIQDIRSIRSIIICYIIRCWRTSLIDNILINSSMSCNRKKTESYYQHGF